MNHTLDDRFFLLNFDDLCNEPQHTVTQLTKFITGDSSIASEKLTDLTKLVSSPVSVNRYLGYDYENLFDARAIKSVEELGFIV